MSARLLQFMDRFQRGTRRARQRARALHSDAAETDADDADVPLYILLHICHAIIEFIRYNREDIERFLDETPPAIYYFLFDDILPCSFHALLFVHNINIFSFSIKFLHRDTMIYMIHITESKSLYDSLAQLLSHITMTIIIISQLFHLFTMPCAPRRRH